MNKTKRKNNPVVIDNKSKPITIGHNILGEISKRFPLDKYSQIALLTDINTREHWASILKKKIGRKVVQIVVPSGENSKNLGQVGEIWKQMIENDLDRHSLLINLGGGVICDMGGFAASTFMRGLDFLNIPTTLLAQVDASIGGKTGFNFSGIKNLIGTFNQPIGVIIDIQTLASLPQREFLSGFAEIIKHGLIKNKNYFERVTSKHPSQFTQDELVSIIAESCKIKINIVRVDEKEQNTRKVLNFGHTIGHAVESLNLETTTPLLHGEAISIGMLTEATISHIAGLLSASDLQQIRKALINAELPTSITNATEAKILQKIRLDKKNEKGKVNFTLLKNIGTALYNQNVPETVVVEGINQNL